MKIDTYNQNGEKVGSIDLPDAVFGVEINPTLLHQAVVAEMANKRQVIAHTKGRGEVRGGGKKPWRQKGTGRARHGSRRSPIWKGGGVTFGPTKYRNFKQKINKKMKRAAYLMALSSKAKDGELIVLDILELKQPKTREMFLVRDTVVPGVQSAFLMLAAKNDTIERAARNIADFKVGNAGNTQLLDLLNYKYLLMTQDAVKKLEEKYHGTT